MLKFKTSCAVLANLSSNLLNEVGLSLFRYFEVGLRVCDIVVNKYVRYLISWWVFVTFRVDSKSFLWAIRSVQKGTYPNFRQRPMSDMRYCVLKPIHCSAAWRPIWKKFRLNWKLNISNAADNAYITQSQTRDTRHRRMQEVNSLCTDSRLLRVVYCIVSFHTIQPSSLAY